LPDNANLNSVEEAMIVFDNVTKSHLADEKQFVCYDIKYNFLPQFFTDWVICHAWLLYLTDNIKSSISMLKDVIGKIQNIIRSNNYHEIK